MATWALPCLKAQICLFVVFSEILEWFSAWILDNVFASQMTRIYNLLGESLLWYIKDWSTSQQVRSSGIFCCFCSMTWNFLPDNLGDPMLSDDKFRVAHFSPSISEHVAHL